MYQGWVYWKKTASLAQTLHEKNAHRSKNFFLFV